MLGVSRSELFARAMDEYLDRQADGSVTVQINDALGRQGDDDLSGDVSAQGLLTIEAATIGDEW